MIVSQQWLNDYVPLPASREDWVQRLTMTGLNHDGTAPVGSDWAVHLEVTSNRPDCLGHVGVAREIAAALALPLNVPNPQPATGGAPLPNAGGVLIEAPQLCARFTARLIRGVQVAASPRWLVERLATIGINSVNNVVDISNYVMFESGQPLHTFDFAKLQGGRIVVREPRVGETLQAIDHRQYALEPGMCVIADAERAVGLGGVMGGAETEVSPATVDVLVEAAQFSPVAIRRTARKLNLHSPASHRFERTVDGHRLDWASLRCCQLILELAGGELAPGVWETGSLPPPPQPIVLRATRIPAVLGIPISLAEAQPILERLGFSTQQASAESLTVLPPSWRRDVTREIDLIEEVGRIHGYEHVPDDVPVPIAASRRRSPDRLADRVRQFLVSAGFDEAMSSSLVPAAWGSALSPWTDAEPLVSHQPMLGVLEKSSQNVGPVNQLRRSIVPSLLEAYRVNEYRANADVHLFEIASVYLPRPSGLPGEPRKLALLSQRPFRDVKSFVESLVQYVGHRQPLAFRPWDHPLADVNLAGQFVLSGQPLGFIGVISEAGKRQFGFRQTVVLAELDWDLLQASAVEIARFQEVSPFPSIQRDFNFIVAETTPWADLESVVRRSGGPLLGDVQFKELFRDPLKDGDGRKRFLLSIHLQSHDQTLTSAEAEAVCNAIIESCQRELQAKLLR